MNSDNPILIKPSEIQQIAMQAFHETLIKHATIKSCLNCYSFNKDTEVCAVANARPPAQILVYSCPAWDREIPF